MKLKLGKEKIIIGLLYLQAIISLVFNTPYAFKSILLAGSTAILAFLIFTKENKKINSKLLVLISMYLSFSLLSFLMSQTSNLGLAELTQDMILFSQLLFLSSLNKKTINLKQTLINISYINIFIQFFTSSYQQITSTNLRHAGTFFNHFVEAQLYPNALALSLIPAIILTLPNKKSKLLHYIPFVLGIITMLNSLSRGASLSLIAACIPLLLLSIKNKEYKHLAKLFSSAIISILLFSLLIFVRTNNDLPTNSYINKVNFSGTERVTSINDRSGFLINSIELIKQKPFIGFGPNSFQEIYPTVQKNILSNSLHPHNIILKTQVERGIFTTLSFLLLCIVTSYLYIKNDDFDINVFLSIVGIFIHNSIDYNLNFYFNLFFAILILSCIWQSIDKNFKYPKLGPLITATLFLGYFTTVHISYQKPDLSILDNSQLNYLNSYQLSNNLIESTEKHVSKNQYDSKAYNYLGSLYLGKSDYQSAIKNFEKSLSVDSKNFWNPYANLVTSINKTDKKLIKKHEAQIIQELKSYNEAAKVNLHYTSQSNNIKEAIFTAEALQKNNKLSTENQQEVTKILNELRHSQKTFSRN